MKSGQPRIYAQRRSRRSRQALLEELARRDGPNCHYCGASPHATRIGIDHKIPLSLAPEQANTVDNMVLSCSTCNAKKGAKEYKKYLSEFYSETSDAYGTFAENLADARKMAKLPVPSDLEQLHLRLLHANLITILEAYLADTLLSLVSKRADLRRRVVETAPEFREQRFDYCEIFERWESVEDDVNEYVSSQLYHNLAKALAMYRDVLGVVTHAELSDIFRAILVRHDIVHRNGKDKRGNSVVVTQSSLEELATSIEAFVNDIARQIPTAT